MKSFHRDSYRFVIMNYLFYNCILPARALRFMGSTTKGIQKQLHVIEKDGWIKCVECLGKKHYMVNCRMSAYMKYEECFFLDFNIHHQKRKRIFFRSDFDSENGVARNQRIKRLEMMSESSIFLAEAGVSILPYEKPSLEAPELRFEHPAFYQSVEIKDCMVEEEARSMASRMTGCICYENEIWSVYTLSDDLIKAGDIIEKLMVEKLNHFFSSKGREMQVEDTFLFTWKFEKIHEKLLLTSSFGSFFYLNDNYRRYYLIPYSREGRRLTALLLRKHGAEELMNMIVRSTWRKDLEHSMVDVDGIDENGVFIFNYLIPDVYRMKKFIRSATLLKEKRFHVFCHAFQEKALKKELPHNVTYSVYDFDTVEVLCIKRIERRTLNG